MTFKEFCATARPALAEQVFDDFTEGDTLGRLYPGGAFIFRETDPRWWHFNRLILMIDDEEWDAPANRLCDLEVEAYNYLYDRLKGAA